LNAHQKVVLPLESDAVVSLYSAVTSVPEEQIRPFLFLTEVARTELEVSKIVPREISQLELRDLFEEKPSHFRLNSCNLPSAGRYTRIDNLCPPPLQKYAEGKNKRPS